MRTPMNPGNLRAMVVWMSMCLVLGLSGTASAALVGYWPLDGDAVDASGNGNDGTIQGNVTVVADRFGNANGAMLFGGDGGDRIEVSDAPEFRITGAITLMAWVWLDSTSTRNGRIVAKMGAGGSRSWSLNIEHSWEGVTDSPLLWIAEDGNTLVDVFGDSPLPAEQWVHFAAVYTPGTSMEIFLDGNLVSSLTSGVPASQFSDNGVPVIIGNRVGASDNGWVGAIDEVRIYDEALSVAEIQAAMNEGGGSSGGEGLLKTFDCGNEGFVPNGSVDLTDNIGSLTFVPKGQDPFMTLEAAIDGTAAEELAMQINVTDSPVNSFPAAFFWFADGGHGRAGFTLDGDGDYTVRMNVPASQDSGAASWDASVHTIRLDFPDLGDSSDFINAGTMFTLDWLAITNDPGYSPPAADDASGDCDGDGLSNGYENILGTDPFVEDTDGDGVSDGLEVQNGTDPLDPVGFPIIPVAGGLGLAALALALTLAGLTLLRRRTA